MSHFFKLSVENPVLQLVAVIVALAVLALAFVLGFVVIAVLAGVSVVALLGLRLKMAWRKWRGGPAVLHENKPPQETSNKQSSIIEAEYKVISRDDQQ